MSTFHLLKTKDGFYPADQDAVDKAKKVNLNEVVEAKSIDQRNYRFLKKYWKLVDVTLHNLPESVEQHLQEKHQFRIKTKEDLHFYLKLKGGYVEKKFVGKDGNIGWVPKSISFSEMDQAEFDDYFSDALDNCAKLLTVESDDLMNEVVSFMG